MTVEAPPGLTLVSSASQSSGDDPRVVPPTRTRKKKAKSADGDLFGQTVQDIHDALSAMHVWATAPSALDPDHKLSIGAVLMSPCNSNLNDVNQQPPLPKQPQREEKQKSILGGALSACNCNAESSALSKVKRIVNDAVNIQAASGSNDYGEVSLLDSQEEEEMQMRRLTSWGTNGTAETIGTAESSLLTVEHNPDPAPLDDDGNPIDRRLLEKTIKASQKRNTKRKRLVKFDYPPVSSFRQCPRAAAGDLPNMFFTAEELDQYEDDRISTWAADDVEVVAVSSSGNEQFGPPPIKMSPETSTGPPTLLAECARSPSPRTPTPSSKSSRASKSSPRSPRSPRNRSSPKNLAKSPKSPPKSPRTPSSLRNPSRSPTKSSPSKNTTTPRSLRGSSLNNRKSSSPFSYSESDLARSNNNKKQPGAPPRKESKKRLVKSVQIYLRERSTGGHGEPSDTY